MSSKKEIGAITFHSSYNHGSVLQAYALQAFCEKNFGATHNYHIINLRTKRQKEYYSKPCGCASKNLLKRLIVKILYAKYMRCFRMRKEAFETFISDRLNTTQEFPTCEAIRNARLNYDYYISGSDQIWNYPILDFDWSFFLEFCDTGKKISYAASFGPKRRVRDKKDEKRIRDDLATYDDISVRELGSLKIYHDITGRADGEIHVDPTLLLDASEWDELANERLIDGDYIFLYDLKSSKVAYEIADRLSKHYRIPVVVVKENAKMQILYRRFLKKYEAGPCDFLSLVKNAKIVVSSSFHGTIFSMIFGKPFVAVDAKHDNRISDILRKAKLEKRMVDKIDEIPTENDLLKTDYREINMLIKKERSRSRKYLSDALEYNDESTK